MTCRNNSFLSKLFFLRMNRINCNGYLIYTKKYIKEGLRNILRPQWRNITLEWFAEKLNPKIRGWINYYTKYSKYETYQVFYYLNTLIRSWIKNKYRINSKAKMYDKYRALQQATPDLFYHWQKGILTWLNNKSRVRGDFQARFCERLKLKCFCLLDCSFLSQTNKEYKK